MPIDFSKFQKKGPDSQEKKIVPGVDFAKPKPAKKILGDKDFTKDEIVDYIADNLKKNKDTYTLDWLRGKKMDFDCVYEMRKER